MATGSEVVGHKKTDSVRHLHPSYFVLRQVTHLIELVEPVSGQVYGSGTGVAISNRMMLTAGHIADAVNSGPSLKLMTNGQELKVFKVDKVRDIALLIGSFETWIPIADTRAEIDSEIVAVGYPVGIGPVITDGRVMKYDTQGDFRYMLVTTSIAPGNSGGGLFQWRGSLEDGHYVLVGITVALMAGCNAFGCNPVHHLTLAADINSIHTLIRNQ
jgi:S1-C subfamily serine protease